MFIWGRGHLLKNKGSTVFNGKIFFNHTGHKGHEEKTPVNSSFVYLVSFVIRPFPVNYGRAKISKLLFEFIIS